MHACMYSTCTIINNYSLNTLYVIVVVLLHLLWCVFL